MNLKNLTDALYRWISIELCTADREVTNQTVGRSCRSDDQELKTRTTEPHFFSTPKSFQQTVLRSSCRSGSPEITMSDVQARDGGEGFPNLSRLGSTLEDAAVPSTSDCLF